jgi:hypothetical protein
MGPTTSWSGCAPRSRTDIALGQRHSGGALMRAHCSTRRWIAALKVRGRGSPASSTLNPGSATAITPGSPACRSDWRVCAPMPSEGASSPLPALASCRASALKRRRPAPPSPPHPQAPAPTRRRHAPHRQLRFCRLLRDCAAIPCLPASSPCLDAWPNGALACLPTLAPASSATGPVTRSSSTRTEGGAGPPPQLRFSVVVTHARRGARRSG